MTCLSKKSPDMERPEPYVDPDQAAAFLNTNRLKVVRMARSGTLPAYPLGSGKRREWRFKLSELDKYMQTRLNERTRPCAIRREGKNGATVSERASQDCEA